VRITNNVIFKELDPNPLKTPEIREEIFYHFNVEEIGTLAQVCKEWHATSKSFHILLNQLQEIKSLTFKEVLNWLQLIQHRCHKNLSVLELIQKCPHLKKLDLSYSTVNDEDIANLAKIELSYLKELNLQGCIGLVHPDFTYFPSLEYLNLNGCNRLEIAFAELRSIFPEPIQLHYDDLDTYLDLLHKIAATAILFWELSLFA